jgi:hypothetical protein
VKEVINGSYKKILIPKIHKKKKKVSRSSYHGSIVSFIFVFNFILSTLDTLTHIVMEKISFIMNFDSSFINAINYE